MLLLIHLYVANFCDFATIARFVIQGIAWSISSILHLVVKQIVNFVPDFGGEILSSHVSDQSKCCSNLYNQK